MVDVFIFVFVWYSCNDFHTIISVAEILSPMEKLLKIVLTQNGFLNARFNTFMYYLICLRDFVWFDLLLILCKMTLQFLSMKLEAVNSRLSMSPSIECFPSKEVSLST